MLISNSKKFIFIHIPKNAGQSITSTLLKYCVSDAEKLVVNLFGARNYIRINSKLIQYLNTSLYRHNFKDHEKAVKVREALGESFSSYFKFAIVRNPWDWLFSNYTYTLKNKRHYRHNFVKNNINNFNEYVEFEFKNGGVGKYNQSNFIFDSSGNQLVDFIGRFESIETDFEYICNKLNIVERIPHFNRSNNQAYKEYYSEDSKELVRTLFSRDIELFNYDY